MSAVLSNGNLDEQELRTQCGSSLMGEMSQVKSIAHPPHNVRCSIVGACGRSEITEVINKIFLMLILDYNLYSISTIYINLSK